MGISSQINYYEKKAIDQRVRYTQKQCAVLSNQIVNNGFRNYNMSSLSGESGASLFEVEQLANNLEGRILLIDSRLRFLLTHIIVTVESTLLQKRRFML